MIQLNGKITDVAHFTASQVISPLKICYFSSFLVRFFLPFHKNAVDIVKNSYRYDTAKIKTLTTETIQKSFSGIVFLFVELTIIVSIDYVFYGVYCQNVDIFAEFRTCIRKSTVE